MYINSIYVCTLYIYHHFDTLHSNNDQFYKKKLAFGKVSANQLKPINIIHDQTQLYHPKKL